MAKSIFEFEDKFGVGSPWKEEWVEEERKARETMREKELLKAKERISQLGNRRVNHGILRDESSLGPHYSRMIQISISQDAENVTHLTQIIEEVQTWTNQSGDPMKSTTVYVTENLVRNVNAPIDKFQEVWKTEYLQNASDSIKGLIPATVTCLNRDENFNSIFSLLDEWTVFIALYVKNRSKEDKKTWLDHYYEKVIEGMQWSAAAAILPWGMYAIRGNSIVSGWLSGMKYGEFELGKVIAFILTYFGLAPTSPAGIPKKIIPLLVSLSQQKNKGMIADMGMSIDGTIWDAPRTPYNEHYDQMSRRTYSKFETVLINRLER